MITADTQMQPLARSEKFMSNNRLFALIQHRFLPPRHGWVARPEFGKNCAMWLRG